MVQKPPEAGRGPPLEAQKCGLTDTLIPNLWSPETGDKSACWLKPSGL